MGSHVKQKGRASPGLVSEDLVAKELPVWDSARIADARDFVMARQLRMLGVMRRYDGKCADMSATDSRCIHDFTEFAEGVGINTIVKALNREQVRGRRKVARGWTPSTISRILKNEKYIGRWTWNRTETRRDPRTGRKRRHPKAPSEWHLTENEDLRIVFQETWERVVARWKEIDRAWPIAKSRRTSPEGQRSYVETHPPHLLAGMLRCATCGNNVAQVSGKGGGYYGCLTAARHACSNRLLVRRRIAEGKLIAAVRDRLADADSIQSVLQSLEREIRRLCADLPENLRLKRASLANEERRISNFVDFIGDGKGTRALAQALAAAEQRATALLDEISALETATETILEPPPVEWVTERLGKLQDLLERETSRSAILLRKILGSVVLRPTHPEVGKPYYQAETTLQIVDLLHDPEGGSNWLRKWRRGELNPRPKVIHREPLHA